MTASLDVCCPGTQGLDCDLGLELWHRMVDARAHVIAVAAPYDSDAARDLRTAERIYRSHWMLCREGES